MTDLDYRGYKFTVPDFKVAAKGQVISEPWKLANLSFESWRALSPTERKQLLHRLIIPN
jgi:hypothetical protein